MNLSSIRYGFATNSSSTHSVVVNPTMKEFYDNTHGTYHWEDFLLTSPEEKANYVRATLAANLKDACYQPPGPSQQREYQRLTGQRLPQQYDGYVDHQSIMAIPTEFANPKRFNKEYYEELFDYMVNSPLGISGGNDNVDKHKELNYGDEHPFLSRHLYLMERRSEDVVARKDSGWWTLFDRNYGTKIRFSFVDLPAPTCSTRPELVDVKITDKCPHAKKCPAPCYQGSTQTAPHALFESICKVLDVLAKREVFEVAFGGGEPTCHPKFAAIVKYARKLGITPNFTTFDLSWRKKKGLTEIIKRYAGAYAVSVNSREEFDKIDKRWPARNSVQSILGLNPTDFYLDLIGKAPLTLLGFKQTGRALEMAPPYKINMDAILAKAKESQYTLGLDTVAVAQHKDELDRAGVHENLRVGKEGSFSMYVDCVEMKMGPSSFCAANEYVSFNDDSFGELLSSKFPFSRE